MDLVLEIHRRHCGGSPLLDRGKLESALARPLHGTSDGSLFYPTIIDQAGALLDGLAHAHAFVDGNKRLTWMITTLYLELHGLRVRYMDEGEAGKFVEEVTAGIHGAAVASAWLRTRVLPDPVNGSYI